MQAKPSRPRRRQCKSYHELNVSALLKRNRDQTKERMQKIRGEKMLILLDIVTMLMIT